jgi:uncharacterized protein DUF58
VQAWIDSILNYWKKARFWIDVAAVIRLNGILVLGVAAFCLVTLAKPNPDLPTFFDPESFFETFALLLLAIILFYLSAVVLPYLWFFLNYYLLRNERNQILFKFPRETCTFGEEFAVDAILQKKMRLIFGVIKFRLVFFNYDTTDWYFLLRSQKQRGQLFQSSERGAVGSFGMRFRHLGRFRTRYSLVKFEDPLGLFSFPIIEKEYDELDPQKNFYIYSVPAVPTPEAAPFYVLKQKVAEASEKSYRVTEDFFDTKRYEPSDDSRRMLWKVFARSRQLLIRIPDRDSSIDADVDVHILFYNSLFIRDGDLNRALYDAYIEDIASFLQSMLQARPLQIRIHCDSNLQMPYEPDPHASVVENIKRGIVSNYWHRNVTPAEYLHHVNENRSPDRERLIIVNPYIDPSMLPLDELQQFTNQRLLGYSEQPWNSGTSKRAILFQSKAHRRRSWFPISRKRMRRSIDGNFNSLRGLIPEGGRRGSN